MSYLGDIFKQDGVAARFVRNRDGDFLLVDTGRCSVSVPLPIIKAAMSGEWEADSLDRSARHYVEGGSNERFDVA